MTGERGEADLNQREAVKTSFRGTALARASCANGRGKQGETRRSATKKWIEQRRRRGREDEEEDRREKEEGERRKWVGGEERKKKGEKKMRL